MAQLSDRAHFEEQAASQSTSGVSLVADRLRGRSVGERRDAASLQSGSAAPEALFAGVSMIIVAAVCTTLSLALYVLSSRPGLWLHVHRIGRCTQSGELADMRPQVREFAVKVREHAKELASDGTLAAARIVLERPEREGMPSGFDQPSAKKGPPNAHVHQRVAAPKYATIPWASTGDLRTASPALDDVRTIALMSGRAETSGAGSDGRRDTAIRELVHESRVRMRAQRELFAHSYEWMLLDDGFDVRIVLDGWLKDHLIIEYTHCNAGCALTIADGGASNDAFLRSIEAVGFRRVTFSDGHNAVASYALRPLTEEDVLAHARMVYPNEW